MRNETRTKHPKETFRISFRFENERATCSKDNPRERKSIHFNFSWNSLEKINLHGRRTRGRRRCIDLFAPIRSPPVIWHFIIPDGTLRRVFQSPWTRKSRADLHVSLSRRGRGEAWRERERRQSSIRFNIGEKGTLSTCLLASLSPLRPADIWKGDKNEIEKIRNWKEIFLWSITIWSCSFFYLYNNSKAIEYFIIIEIHFHPLRVFFIPSLFRSTWIRSVYSKFCFRCFLLIN